MSGAHLRLFWFLTFIIAGATLRPREPHIIGHGCRACSYCNPTAVQSCQATSTRLATPSEPLLLSFLRTSNPRVAGSNPAERALDKS